LILIIFFNLQSGIIILMGRSNWNRTCKIRQWK